MPENHPSLILRWDTLAHVEYLPTSGHVCTSCVDALLDDEPGAYRGRHRADMAVGESLSHEPLALTGAAGPIVASCGSYMPGQPFRVLHGDRAELDELGVTEAVCDHPRQARHRPISEAYAEWSVSA